MIQPNPFRNGCRVLDTRYLDGLEINSHPLYGNSFKEELVRAADSSGLILTSGGDYHADTYRPHCGVYLPDFIKDETDLARYLRETDTIKLCIHEPGTPASYDFTYKRI